MNVETCFIKSSIRITESLRNWILKKAIENRRSFSGEVQYRMEKLMEEEVNAKVANSN